MIKVTIRWVFVLAILFGVGPMAARVLLGSLRGPDGSLETTILTSAAPAGAIVGLGLVAIVAGVCGALGSRLFGRDVGFGVAGCVLAWGAWRCGLPEHIVRVRASGAPLMSLALENALAGVIALVVGGVVVVLARDVNPASGRARATALVVGEGDDPARTPLALVACTLGATIAAGAAAYFIAIESLKGQTVMAALCAGIAGAAASHVIGLSMGVRAGVLPPVLGVVLAAIAGPIIARTLHGGDVVDVATRARLFALARPAPLDWAAGALLGVPVGWGWSHSMTEQHTHVDASLASHP